MRPHCAIYIPSFKITIELLSNPNEVQEINPLEFFWLTEEATCIVIKIKDWNLATPKKFKCFNYRFMQWTVVPGILLMFLCKLQSSILPETFASHLFSDSVPKWHLNNLFLCSTNFTIYSIRLWFMGSFVVSVDC